MPTEHSYTNESCGRNCQSNFTEKKTEPLSVVNGCLALLIGLTESEQQLVVRALTAVLDLTSVPSPKPNSITVDGTTPILRKEVPAKRSPKGGTGKSPQTLQLMSRIVEYLEENGQQRPCDIAQALNVPKLKLRDTIKHLVKEGKVIPDGSNSNRVYFLSTSVAPKTDSSTIQ